MSLLHTSSLILICSEKNYPSKALFQSTDSDSVRDSNDSLGPIQDLGFQTPVKAKSQKNTKKLPSNDLDDGDGDDEQDSRLQQQRNQLLLERKQLDIERKQFEYDKKLFETEKMQFDNDKKAFQKQKERMEQERMNQSEGTPAQTPTKVAENENEYEEKYNKLMKDYEDLRRENISLQLEIEKGKKTLEAEKNVDHLVIFF